MKMGRRSSLAAKSKSKKFTAFTAEAASWEKRIEDLPGIGQKTAAKLKEKGIEYVSKRIKASRDLTVIIIAHNL